MHFWSTAGDIEVREAATDFWNLLPIQRTPDNLNLCNSVKVEYRNFAPGDSWNLHLKIFLNFYKIVKSEQFFYARDKWSIKQGDHLSGKPGNVGEFSGKTYASAQRSVAGGIMVLSCPSVHPSVRPETLTWYLAEYLTHFQLSPNFNDGTEMNSKRRHSLGVKKSGRCC